MTSDLTNQLEDAIRAELRAEVRWAPSGAATKASVLNSVAGVPMDSDVRPLRRWLVPMLAAAAVVLVAVGVTAAPRILASHRGAPPAHHQSSVITPELPAPKPAGDPVCSAARGETLVDGARTTYHALNTGELRYVFEYYCAGSDGHRSGSSLQVFRMVNGTLRFDQEVMQSGSGNYVLSLTGGGEDAFLSRLAIGLGPDGAKQLPGVVEDEAFLVSTGEGSSAGNVTDGCLSSDLTVRIASAQQPTPHLVLQLTNASKVDCALWGNPRYAPVNGAGVAGKQPVRYVLRGPAGGVSSAPSAPAILLEPGATASASIGTDRQTGCTPSTAVRVTLANGIDLGLQNIGLCNIVSYPLVAGSGGDDSADYSTVPQPAGPTPCVDSGSLFFGSHPVSSQSGDAAGLVLTIKLLNGPPCTLSGYPDVRAVDSSYRLLVAAAHTPNGFFGGLPTGTTTPPTVTLTAGQTASALVEWAAAAYTPTSTCHRNGLISLTLGGAGATYGPTIGQLCDLVVHPIVAGDTGSQ